jgi:hypothetical protein
MPPYQSFDPSTEVIGTSLVGFTKSMVHDNLTEILARYHLDKIDPQAWYPVQTLLDLFGEISNGVEPSPTFISLGVAVAQAGLQAMPAAAKAVTLEQFFASYNDLWQSRHRNGDAGYIKYEAISPNHLVLKFKTPYPDDILYGLIYAYARFFCPKDQTTSVAYDDHFPRRDLGGKETIIHIRLE